MIYFTWNGTFCCFYFQSKNCTWIQTPHKPPKLQPIHRNLSNPTIRQCDSTKWHLDILAEPCARCGCLLPHELSNSIKHSIFSLTCVRIRVINTQSPNRVTTSNIGVWHCFEAVSRNNCTDFHSTKKRIFLVKQFALFEKKLILSQCLLRCEQIY